MTDHQQPYCAALAKAAAEPLLGTAPRVDVWLMLEYQPTWQAKAITANDLPAAVNDWLAGLVEQYAQQGLIARPQFIRRRRDRDHQITFFVNHDGRLRRYQLSGYAELCDLNPLATAGETVSQPQYFVCTNGRRDRCCSKFGLPVYGALRDLVGGRAWETTHVGGHRFAANVVVLPQGALYGYIDVANVGRFVTDIEQERLSLPFLRGRSAYPPAAQVAETALTDPLELLSSGEDFATFRTTAGQRTIRITRAAEPVTIVPSCNAEPELVYPLRLATPAD